MHFGLSAGSRRQVRRINRKEQQEQQDCEFHSWVCERDVYWFRTWTSMSDVAQVLQGIERGDARAAN